MQNEEDSWYDSLCLSIQRSHELGCTPFKTPLLTLGLEKEGLSGLFHEKRAKWLKLCRNHFSTLKLERAQKRKAGDSNGKDNESGNKLPRRSTDTEARQGSFFLEETSGELHRASTFNLERNVRESAHILNDTFLIRKLSAGDMVTLDPMYHTQCSKDLQESCKSQKSKCYTN